jgi:hypothetical protein
VPRAQCAASAKVGLQDGEGRRVGFKGLVKHSRVKKVESIVEVRAELHKDDASVCIDCLAQHRVSRTH